MDAERLASHKVQNWLHSLFLVLSMLALLGLLGWLLAGRTGLLWSLALVVLIGLFGHRISPAWVLRMYRARPLSRRESPELYELLGRICQRAGLAQLPRLYYLRSRMLNAFAVGRRDEASIVVTDGLLRNLNVRELIGVLAHEVAHVRNDDLWVMGLADIVSRITLLLSQFGQIMLFLSVPAFLLGQFEIPWLGLLVLVFAPLVSTLMQLALNRVREYDADLEAARITGDPQGLASALEKLEYFQGGWMERIFMPGRRLPEPALLRTHPHTRERVERLLLLKPERPRLEGMPQGPPHHLAAMQGLAGARRAPRWHWSGLW